MHTVHPQGPPSYPAGAAEEAADRELARLIAKRLADPRRTDLVPSQETLTAWAAETEANRAALTAAFEGLATASVRAENRRRMAAFDLVGREAPERVVPLMLEARVGRARAWVTHMVQFPSTTELDVRLRPPERDVVAHSRYAVDLEVLGDAGITYVVIPQGAHSGGREQLARYAVVPRLPDDLAGVTLRLVAGDRLHASAAPPRTLRPHRPAVLRPPSARRRGIGT